VGGKDVSVEELGLERGPEPFLLGSIEATATRRTARPLARMTRPRCGIWGNVVSPVRWLHSPVTDRMAIIGRRMAIGKPVARVKVLKVRSSAEAKRITPIVARRDAMPMLASSQKPVLVSNDLRSSTETIRESGIGFRAAARITRGVPFGPELSCSV
jgi:hypothetical protein